MDLRGRICTLYPISWQGAVVPPGRPINFDVTMVVQSFQIELVARLSNAGLDLRMPTPGALDPGLVIRPQVVLADPGRPFELLTWLSSDGAAAFEVEGMVGDASAPFGHFHASGRGRATWMKQDPQQILAAAAGRAGGRAAKQVLRAMRGSGSTGPNQPQSVYQGGPGDGAAASNAAASGGNAAPPQLRSPLQWRAYVRVRLLDGWPLQQVLSEVAAAAVSPAAAYGFVAEAAKEMRKRAWPDLIWGPIGVAIGVLAVLGATADMEKTGRNNLLIWFWVLVPIGAAQTYRALRILSRIPKVPRQ